VPTCFTVLRKRRESWPSAQTRSVRIKEANSEWVAKLAVDDAHPQDVNAGKCSVRAWETSIDERRRIIHSDDYASTVERGESQFRDKKSYKQKNVDAFLVLQLEMASYIRFAKFIQLKPPMKQKSASQSGFFNLRVLIRLSIAWPAFFWASSPRRRKYGLPATRGRGILMTLPPPLPLTAQEMFM
jgi:hypothetical protein